MPRLNNKIYVDRHRFLKKAWTEFQTLYTLLPVPRQWSLHAYFQPTKDLSEAELLEHRRLISKSDPWLAASAGRDFERMYQAFRLAFEVSQGDEKLFRRAIFEQVPASAKSKRKNKQGDRTVVVTAIARPEPNVPSLGRAIMMMAEKMTTEENDERRYRP